MKAHIPQFESEDSEELVECLLVLGVNAFLDASEGTFNKSSVKQVRNMVGTFLFLLRTSLS